MQENGLLAACNTIFTGCQQAFFAGWNDTLRLGANAFWQGVFYA
jgi:hypothetical protein